MTKQSITYRKGLFPACAGVILCQAPFSYYRVAFPRVCGGDPAVALYTEISNNFSPRVRG